MNYHDIFNNKKKQSKCMFHASSMYVCYFMSSWWKTKPCSVRYFGGLTITIQCSYQIIQQILLYSCNNSCVTTDRNFIWSPIQTDNWSEKAKRRKTTGTGRARHLKLVRRRFRNGFREGGQAKPRQTKAWSIISWWCIEYSKLNNWYGGCCFFDTIRGKLNISQFWNKHIVNSYTN